MFATLPPKRLAMTITKLLLTFLSASLLWCCTGSQYTATNKAHKKQVKAYGKILGRYPLRDSFETAETFVGTTNFGMRKPNFVIIHHTAQNSTAQTLRTFTLPRTAVSAHYVIGRDGKVYHMLSDYLRAQHAGLGKWGSLTDMNSCSIGIELDNNGFEPFAPAQIDALCKVLFQLKKAFSIPAANFIGHADWAPTRKNDPNWRFPWKALAEQGFGLWPDDTTGTVIPTGFNHLQGLRLIGYDTQDSVAAIKAFKQHWLQDTTKGMTAAGQKVLVQLLKRY
jgi:N-acetylmuramoyl-L-alanine amidase